MCAFGSTTREEDGLEVLKAMLNVEPQLQVVIITAYGTIESAVEAMRLGAVSYLTKPLNLEELKLTLAHAVKHYHLARQVQELSRRFGEEKFPWGIVTRSKAMDPVLSLIDKAKDIDSTVLITGETGTGKELVARALHFGGKRASGPWEVVNCAAIPETLLEGELFGYKSGAFTGAVRSHTGRFVAAHGGTLFLDEVAELSPALQAKLLRVLEDREVRPLGSEKSRRVDVRVVAATGRNLKEEVAQGHFRADFYFRLNVVPIHVPPLRERREDISLLAAYFLDRAKNDLNRPGLVLNPEALLVLENYSFPGNVRELQNILERAVILSNGDMVSPRHLPKEMQIASDGYRSKARRLITLPVGITLKKLKRSSY